MAHTGWSVVNDGVTSDELLVEPAQKVVSADSCSEPGGGELEGAPRGHSLDLQEAAPPPVLPVALMYNLHRETADREAVEV